MGAPIAMPPRPASRLSALALLVCLAGCGHHTVAQTHARPAQKQPPSQGGGGSGSGLRAGSPRRVAVVRHWADSLRAGRVNEASSYFALPLIVQNGTPPLRLTTKAQLLGFNDSLPCGARVVRSVTDGGRYTIVVFKLTERKGRTPGCGTGLGHLAATAFAFRHGKISEWRRSSVPPKVPSQVAA